MLGALPDRKQVGALGLSKGDIPRKVTQVSGSDMNARNVHGSSTMSVDFRHVSSPEINAVCLTLLTDNNGQPRAEICAPLDTHAPAVDRCIVDLKTAMMAAIRIANTHDTEVVVLGDASLWKPEWGKLSASNGATA